jgi:hypothetical protein
LYKANDIVSGLGVIRIENNPIAAAISLAHNCIAEKNSPLDLGIETGKSSLDLFKNLQKIENLNNKESFTITKDLTNDKINKKQKIVARRNKILHLTKNKDIVNLAEISKKLKLTLSSN